MYQFALDGLYISFNEKCPKDDQRLNTFQYQIQSLLLYFVKSSLAVILLQE